jgi:LruC domain-containing protein
LTGTLEFLSSFDANGVPSDLAPTEIVTADFLRSVNDALPENDPVPSAHPEYLASENDTDIRLLDEAEVWVTFVHEGAGYRNTLGFYTYPISDPPASVEEIDSHTVIFPNVSFRGSGGGLQSGTTVRLGQFPPNTGIGWFLIANGWNGSTVGNGTHVIYSNPDFNPEPNADLRQHNVQLADTQRDLVLLGFEDMRRDSGSDDDFNDALFYVTSNPVEAIDRSALPETDLEPGDTTPPTLTYQPGDGQFASLVFEDLWPAEGDYDFNDMVIDYNITTEANSDGTVAAITATFVTRAAGASFANGFGFSLPISPADVERVTGPDLQEGIVSTRPNGTEAGTDRAVVVVYDNVHNRVDRAGGFFNTQPGVSYMPPDTITVDVHFAAGVSPSDLGTAPYDPFIIVNGDRSREVHLPDQPPTALASPEWFGRSQDTSDPKANRFYKTAANRPWALHLPASFAYPAEQNDIGAAYLHFGDWAESGGTTFADWYSADKPSYRNRSLIYALP